MMSSRYLLTVTRIKKETEEYQSVFFTKPQDFSYKPGGVFDLYFPDKPSDKRIFSFASSPTENEIMIGYRVGTSDFKRRLQTIQIGDEIEIRYIGSTLTDLGKHKNLFIAGGIGITTFRSMIKYMFDTNTFRDCTLFFINRNNFIPYVSEIENWKLKSENLNVHYIQTARHGRLSIEKLMPFLDEIKIGTRVAYISGPPSMVDHTMHLLESLGVDRDLVQTDSFDGYNEEFDIGS